MPKYTPKHEPQLEVRKQEPKPAPTPAAVLAPEAPFDELPEVQQIGLVQMKKGWVVVKTVIQGDRVIAKEVLEQPQPFRTAIDTAKIAFVRMWPHEPKLRGNKTAGQDA